MPWANQIGWFEQIGCPQGFEPRYADPELLHYGARIFGHASVKSITCHNSPHGSTAFKIWKSRALARSDSHRVAQLGHSFPESAGTDCGVQVSAQQKRRGEC